jgi:transposase
MRQGSDLGCWERVCQTPTFLDFLGAPVVSGDGEVAVVRQESDDEVIYLRSAGLDLGKRFLVACVRVPHPARTGRWSLETEKFGTVPREIRRLLTWLAERHVEVVVLEATSDYWRGVYYALQPHLNLMLVNPQHLKGIRGRKSDPSDAAFLARAGASGMVMASFVPSRAIRELRDLTRRRTEVMVMKGQEAQRLEKELEDTGMKLTSVLTDVLGVTGRAILAALIGGERDPLALAALAVGPARKKTDQLADALDGTFTGHHTWMCRHLLAQIDHLDALLVALDTRIAALTRDHDDDLNNLDTIPGIGRKAAEIIWAETGGDMAQFTTAAHLVSWIGVAPGLNESAGINKSARTRNGNAHLKRVLGVAALAAIRTKGTYYSGFYRRVAARRGGRRALVALMRKIVIAIWHILTNKATFHDLGPDYLPKRDPERAMRRMRREAQSLGMTLRFDPIPQDV